MRHGREPVMVRRAVRALQVPSGEAVELEPGQTGMLTQALGGSYTVYVDGALWRIDGRDGDAIGQPVREAVERPADASEEQLRDWVWQELGEVYDPEIPCSIVELGLVYRCEMTRREGEAPREDATPRENGTPGDERAPRKGGTARDGGDFRIDVVMTVTAPGCGMGEQLGNEVADRLLALPRVGEVKVDIVFDPPWDRSMMSEAARLALGLL